MERVIGIDIGGTKTLIGLARSKDQVITHQFQTVIGDFQAFLIELKSNLTQVLEIDDCAISEVRSIVISSPGLLDVESGTVVAAINLNWRNVELVQSIRELSGVDDVILEGDTRCGLIAEFDARSGRYDNMIYLTASTGIGCAIMIDGQILRGAHNFAGEIGQILTREGKRLEEIASGRYLAEEGDSPEHVVSAASALGNCIYNLFQIIDMELCVIGGGLGLGDKDYLKFVQEYLAACEQRSPSGRRYPIEKSIYGTQAPLIGALLIAHNRMGAS
jgi:glucokinase